jgi:hypothetical protein
MGSPRPAQTTARGERLQTTARGGDAAEGKAMPTPRARKPALSLLSELSSADQLGARR